MDVIGYNWLESGDVIGYQHRSVSFRDVIGYNWLKSSDVIGYQQTDLRVVMLLATNTGQCLSWMWLAQVTLEEDWRGSIIGRHSVCE